MRNYEITNVTAVCATLGHTDPLNDRTMSSLDHTITITAHNKIKVKKKNTKWKLMVFNHLVT